MSDGDGRDDETDAPERDRDVDATRANAVDGEAGETTDDLPTDSSTADGDTESTSAGDDSEDSSSAVDDAAPSETNDRSDEDSQTPEVGTGRRSRRRTASYAASGDGSDGGDLDGSDSNGSDSADDDLDGDDSDGSDSAGDERQQSADVAESEDDDSDDSTSRPPEHTPQTPGAPRESSGPEFSERSPDSVSQASSTPEDTAPDDEEMPLSDHIEEMVRRLGVVLVLMAGVSAVVFPFGEQIINTIWYSFLPGTFEQCPTTGTVVTEAGATIKPACPRVYNPLATILARFKVATLAGFIVALPAFVYETYLFMRPGLFPRERRYYLAAVPTSLVLATVGLAFAYLLVLPAIFTYFLYYSEGAADIAFGLTETFDLMVLMMGFFAAIFQIPLFIMLAIMMGVTSREWLADRRLLFWAAFAGVAFIFNPDPTGMAPFIVAATMIALFEGTLLLLSWTGSEGLLPSPDAVAARRPYAWVLAGLTGYLASSAPLPDGYYDALPALVRGFIESNDLVGVTPLVVGGMLVAIYELVVFLLRRYLPVGKWRRILFTGRLSLRRLRPPVWLLSISVGYFASPDPFLLDRANEIALAPVEAAALAGGLIVAFEVVLAIWRFVRPAEGERLPIER